MDNEIRAMEQVANALTELDADVVARVLRWAADRHGVTEKLGWAEEQSSERPQQSDVPDNQAVKPAAPGERPVASPSPRAEPKLGAAPAESPAAPESKPVASPAGKPVARPVAAARPQTSSGGETRDGKPVAKPVANPVANPVAKPTASPPPKHDDDRPSFLQTGFRMQSGKQVLEKTRAREKKSDDDQG